MTKSTADTGRATLTDQPAARQLRRSASNGMLAGVAGGVARHERRPITMPGIIALALIAIVALTVLSLAVHVLFSPWLLVAVAILAWIKFRPRRSHR